MVMFFSSFWYISNLFQVPILSSSCVLYASLAGASNIFSWASVCFFLINFTKLQALLSTGILALLPSCFATSPSWIVIDEIITVFGLRETETWKWHFVIIQFGFFNLLGQKVKACGTLLFCLRPNWMIVLQLIYKTIPGWGLGRRVAGERWIFIDHSLGICW